MAVCGEMLGVMTEAFERTIEYLKSRSQFGVLIGTFQALKHRAAKMFIEIELSRSTVMAAARALDEGDDDAELQVSNAKARCSDALIPGHQRGPADARRYRHDGRARHSACS